MKNWPELPLKSLLTKMCEQLRKIFVNIYAGQKFEGQQLAIKSEPTFDVTPDSEEAFYSNRSQGSTRYCGRGRSDEDFGRSNGGFGRSGGGFGFKGARGNNYAQSTSSSAYEGQGKGENNRGPSRGAIKSSHENLH